MVLPPIPRRRSNILPLARGMRLVHSRHPVVCNHGRNRRHRTRRRASRAEAIGRGSVQQRASTRSRRRALRASPRRVRPHGARPVRLTRQSEHLWPCSRGSRAALWRRRRRKEPCAADTTRGAPPPRGARRRASCGSVSTWRSVRPARENLRTFDWKFIRFVTSRRDGRRGVALGECAAAPRARAGR